MLLHRPWNHSLDVAQAAEMPAGQSQGKIDPDEAFLARLVQDIGRLAFAIMPAQFLATLQSLD